VDVFCRFGFKTVNKEFAGMLEFLQLAAVTWAEELLNSRHKNIIKAAKKTKDADLVKDVVQDYMSLKYDLEKTPMQAKMETALKELKDAAHHVVEKNFDYDHRVEWLDFRKNFIEFYGDENVDVQKLSKLRTLANKIDESVLGPTHYATLGLHETLNKCIRKSIVTLWEPDLLAASIPAVMLQRYINLWGNFQANTTLIYLSLFLKLNLALVDETKIKEMGVVNSTETESLISWKNEMLDHVHETLVEASQRSKPTDVARIREVVEIYDRLKRVFIYPFTNNALRDDVKRKGFKFVEAAKHVLEESEYTKSVYEFTL